MTLSTTKYRSEVLDTWLATRQGGAARAGREVQAVLPENSQQFNLTADELARMLGASALTWSGTAVTPETALRVSTVYACVALIAGAFASLPAGIFERTKNARRRADHDYWWFLNEEANDENTAATCWEYLIAARLFYGDGFGRLLRPSPFSNRVIGWEPLHPQRCEPFRADRTYERLYRVTHLDGSQKVYSSADIIHVPSLGFDGLRSPSPITYAARESVGMAIASEEYSARFYSQGATHDIALRSPKGLTKDQADDLRASYMAKWAGGKNSRVPLVLTGGLEVHNLSITPQDAALLPTRQFTVEEICRVFGVPGFMVGATQKTTSWGSGVEQQGIGFVKYTLRRHLVPVKQEFNRKLWPTRERFFMDFETTDLERGDFKTRMEGYRIAIGRSGEPGWMKPNEARHLENMEPVTGGDKLNSGAAAKGDEKNDDPKPAAPADGGQPDPERPEGDEPDDPSEE